MTTKLNPLRTTIAYRSRLSISNPAAAPASRSEMRFDNLRAAGRAVRETVKRA
jgi:hypothetical protein